MIGLIAALTIGGYVVTVSSIDKPGVLTVVGIVMVIVGNVLAVRASNVYERRILLGQHR